jgi:hypothetical protein
MSAEGEASEAGETGQRARAEAGADAPVTRDAEGPMSGDGVAPVTRDGGAPGRREAEAPTTPDAEAPHAPVTRDVYAPAREHEAPSVAGGRAGIGPASAVSDARGGESGRPEGSSTAGGDLRNAGGELTDARVVEAGEAAAVADAAATGSAADAEKRGRVARMREATRERAARVRDEALVALEETPDDAGLRFVVAAVALFLLSAFLLVLSLTVLR